MFVQDIDLHVDYESMGLKPPEKEPEFTGYILKNYDEYCKGRKRPAVIICPGGGYMYCSEREATPIAMEYLAGGINAFILRYSCKPAVFPTALVQLATAMKLVREHAKEWNIDSEKIIVVGFSAGGHLAASLGVFWNSALLQELGFAGDSHRPNGMILSYPVISAVSYPNTLTFQNLFGKEKPSEEQLQSVSLERHVTSDTPPAFLWHTATDEGVPPQNSLMFALAMLAHRRPLELHLYPTGPHGLSLANELVNDAENVNLKTATWIKFAIDWIKKL